MTENGALDFHGFSGTLPLLQLAHMVLYPRTLLPLHMENPEHSLLLDEVMRKNQLLAVGLVHPGLESSEEGPAFSIGCLAQVVDSQRLENGHMNVLLLGLARVRLGKAQSLEPYPRVQVRALREREVGNRPGEIGPLGLQLMAVYFRVLERSRRDTGRIKDLLRPDITLGTLSDVIAASLPLPVGYKQRILAEVLPRKRGELLLAFLLEILRHPTMDLDPGVFFQNRISLN